MHPRILYAAAVAAMAALVWLAGSPPAEVLPEHAASHVGKDIVVRGVARDIWQRDDAVGFALHRQGWALPVRAPADIAVAEGSWLVVQGRVESWQGRIQLRAAAVEVAAAPASERLDPARLETDRDITRWSDRPLRLVGSATGDHFETGKVRIQRGEGPWPTGGAWEVTGTLRTDPTCLCLRLDVASYVPVMSPPSTPGPAGGVVEVPKAVDAAEVPIFEAAQGTRSTHSAQTAQGDHAVATEAGQPGPTAQGPWT